MKKALMVWGGWEGHEPKQCVDLFAPLLETAGFEVEISDTLDTFLNTNKLSAVDLVTPMWTIGRHQQGTGTGSATGGSGGRQHRRLARGHGRLFQRECRLPVYGRRPVGGSSWQYHRLHRQHH